MAQVDPFTVPLPSKLSRDPETGPFFTYLVKFLHDMWRRTGGGEDFVGNGAQVTADNEFTGDNSFHEPVNLVGSTLNVDGTPVVGAQLPSIADAAAPTASNPTTPTGYSAPAPGAIPLVSDNAGDFTVAAIALETLVNETTSYEFAISALIVDVASIRSQLNQALAALRSHGLIDT